MENSSLKTEVHEFTTLLTLIRLGFLKVVFYGGVKFKYNFMQLLINVSR